MIERSEKYPVWEFIIYVFVKHLIKGLSAQSVLIVPVESIKTFADLTVGSCFLSLFLSALRMYPVLIEKLIKYLCILSTISHIC